VLGWAVTLHHPATVLLETALLSKYFNFAIDSRFKTHLLSRNYHDLPYLQELVASQGQAPLSIECFHAKCRIQG